MCAPPGAFVFQAFASEATVAGNATDPSGAAVPNAAITTTNTETDHARRLATNSEGRHPAPHLQAGRYTARADFRLEAGAGQDSVAVGAASTVVPTKSGGVSDTIAGSQVTQLAVNGPSIYGLTALTAGAFNKSHQRRLHA